MAGDIGIVEISCAVPTHRVEPHGSSEAATPGHLNHVRYACTRFVSLGAKRFRCICDASAPL